MNILFASIECYPFIKMGGLGDVIECLPKELNKLGCDARVILPKFSSIKEELLNNLEYINSFYVFLGTKANKSDLYKLKYDGVIYYFIGNDKYFNREKNIGYEDDAERWAIYQIGVIEAMKYMPDFKVDILNCNDFHTGMIPSLIKAKYYKEYCDLKTVYTIHTIVNQGEFDRQTAKIYNLQFDSSMELNGRMNFMKSGIVAADYVNTVSLTYAKELLKSEYYSMGLSIPLYQKYRQGAFTGILNGINYNVYNPETDPMLPLNYSFENYKEGKRAAKEELYKRLGVDFYSDVPMISIISRLSREKGFDLIMKGIEELLEDNNFKFIIIGTGDRIYEEFFKDLEKRHPYKVKFFNGYSDELAHISYAAADLFLMPSAFEPCGLGQMIALKYGTLPIVRETGGLRDSIKNVNDGDLTGNGFSFESFNANEMIKTVKKAFRDYEDKELWEKLVSNAMHQDFSFRPSAIKYYRLYKKILLNKINN